MLNFQELLLPNGLSFRFIDRSVRYYGDFYRIVIDVECDIPVTALFIADSHLLTRAAAALGEKVVYKRRLEQMGVPSPAMATVAENLVRHLVEHSLPYFSSPRFPEKIILSKMNGIKGGKSTPLFGDH